MFSAGGSTRSMQGHSMVISDTQITHTVEASAGQISASGSLHTS